MQNKFLHADKYSRFFGGGKGDNPIDVYVSGYHYLFITMQPRLKAFIIADCLKTTGVAGQHVIGDPAGILNIHNISLTPPGVSLGKTTNNATGGAKWQTPTNLEIGDEIACKYNEYSGTPIYRIHRGWVNFIKNTNLGITESDQPIYQEDYKATFLYATTRPDGKTIEFGAKFTGVWPTRSPTDVFASDVTNSDKVEIDMTYSIDHMYDNNKEVLQEIQTLINSARAAGVAANNSRITVHK